MLGFGLLRRDDRNHLDLFELMLADEAARIAPRRTGFESRKHGVSAQKRIGNSLSGRICSRTIQHWSG